MKSLRIICRTFIDWLAHSMRFLPRSATSKFLTSQGMLVVVLAIISYLTTARGPWGIIAVTRDEILEILGVGRTQGAPFSHHLPSGPSGPGERCKVVNF